MAPLDPKPGKNRHVPLQADVASPSVAASNESKPGGIMDATPPIFRIHHLEASHPDGPSHMTHAV